MQGDVQAGISGSEILRGDNIWTLTGMLRARTARSSRSVAVWHLSDDGRWTSTSWGDYCKGVAALAQGFRKLGLKHGDRVGIMAASSKEWDRVQLAIAAVGGVAVGLDQHGLEEHIQAIVRSCGFAGIVFGHPEMAGKIGQQGLSALRFMVSLEQCNDSRVVYVGDLVSEAPADDSWDQAEPDDIATIIFTSGTTGQPKGIEYSHRQICLAVKAILAVFPDIREGSHLVCWLPLSNLFQRIINFCAIERGAEIFYVTDPRDVMRYLPTISPHLFIAVPRFYEKLYAGIQETIATKPSWQRWLILWALSVGDRRAAASRAGRPIGTVLKIQLALADRLILSKLRAVLGNNLQFMVSGSAPIPLWLLERFHAMGLLILEAYGLSENVIPVAMNRPDQYRFGTVGKPLTGSEIRLAEDGELQVRGPGVFKGYLGDGISDSPLTADGFLPSGDFASIDNDGFVSLIGRKSEIFKTSTGRRVAPIGIESLLRQVPGIDQVVVFGTGRTLPVALLSVSQAAWENGYAERLRVLRAGAGHAVASLPSYLRPGGLVITPQLLTIARGELTANLKLRRKNIEANYSVALSELYSHLDASGGSPFEVLSMDGQYLYCSL